MQHIALAANNVYKATQKGTAAMVMATAGNTTTGKAGQGTISETSVNQPQCAAACSVQDS